MTLVKWSRLKWPKYLYIHVKNVLIGCTENVPTACTEKSTQSLWHPSQQLLCSIYWWENLKQTHIEGAFCKITDEHLSKVSESQRQGRAKEPSQVGRNEGDRTTKSKVQSWIGSWSWEMTGKLVTFKKSSIFTRSIIQRIIPSFIFLLHITCKILLIFYYYVQY